ncbi:type I DNA topoisomerase [Ehrlichia chaffeensis]|uniref:type I DNA topoisomerase n=1 Tax=Ehrlichia chaffeensis TaxID=945 RepID=UPI000444AA8A|nr:type I DNA topoisomerase [Ehrlichia chaffeensis]AHX07564.1 DNA topoisomerase I [Ehrlichia chaffeensis str. Osceola]AHX08699.1 DNA topoisomerase I [Ehrlichia chaffeensis str. Saint Vincent]AHX09664.1 DNA topoisomerase I [Ehrlichia chaffeensis str. Wakulla]
MSLIIVESPSKAKTISKYLGSKYKVVASFGHIRDFPAKSGSVDPDKDFAMTYEIISKSEKYVNKLIQVANKETQGIYLATDPDREGEAIAWHIIEVLKENNAIDDNVVINRMVFNEVTKSAILESIKRPRSINMDLVYAQQARRALDYLVGFTLSPLLWRKLPGSKSAGRVQSVALRLICDRESDIEKFITQEYWDIEAKCCNTEGKQFSAFLSCYAGKKLEKFDIKNEEDAQKLSEEVRSRSYSVINVEKKHTKRNPYPPFITSSLQQEASTKLGFTAKNTMLIAQKLYEGIDVGGEIVGLITYMRTDGFYIADEALEHIRSIILSMFGKEYLPESARKYVKKVKNAQEAHEAIRPTNITITPGSLSNYLTPEQLKLYDLIWKRTVASQMNSAVIDQVIVELGSLDKVVTLRATGSSLFFDGFYKVYGHGEDDDSKNNMLPLLQKNDKCPLDEVIPHQHFTNPPARYNEASLVKKMEEIGIGRPSTYASIISVLQDRQYVILNQKRFFPTERGRIVNVFLVNFFSRYVEYDFTADLEEKLDLISNGKINWKEVLHQFWFLFIDNVNSVKKLEFTEVLKVISCEMENYIFSSDKSESSRVCPVCNDGTLELNISKNGIFLGCSKYPECKYTKNVGSGIVDDTDNTQYPKILGIDAATGQEIYLKKGPYGLYLQIGNDKSGKRAAIPKNIDANLLDLQMAEKILSLPISLGTHPDTGQEIKLGLGKFGAYILYGGKYFSVKNEHNFLDISIENAINIIANNSTSGVIKSLGITEDNKEVFLCKGRYGFYLKYDKLNVALKKDTDIEQISLSDAIKLISEKL